MFGKLPKKDYIKGVCSGYTFTGCVIKDKNSLYFLAREDLTIDDAVSLNDDDITTRLIGVLNSDDAHLKLGYVELDDFEMPVLGIDKRQKNQLLMLSNDVDGTILPLGGGKPRWPYETLNEGGFPTCEKLRCIDGDTWAVCSRRLLYKRMAIGKWENIRNGFDPQMGPMGDVKNKNCGFQDIDGFSGKDIYAVGGKGDVWNYDGKKWNKCGFPTNDFLYTVCCAKDGFAYIGARNALWKGKNNQWEKVCDFPLPDEMNDMRWFDDKLWIAYDYCLHVWDGNILHEKVIHNDEELPLCGRIDASDDLLLVACSHEAWIYNGSIWHSVIPRFS